MNGLIDAAIKDTPFTIRERHVVGQTMVKREDTRLKEFMEFDPVSHASAIAVPTMVVRSDGSASPGEPKKLYEAVQGENELDWPTATTSTRQPRSTMPWRVCRGSFMPSSRLVRGSPGHPGPLQGPQDGGRVAAVQLGELP